MGSGALIVVINLAGGWWFIRRYVISPVEHLSALSSQLSGGNLAARSALGGSDELANLGVAFNDMAASLQGKVRELQEKEQFLQRLVDAIPDGVRIIDQEYQVILANDTYRQQMHLGQPEGPPGVPEHRCYAAHGRDSPCPTTLVTCPLQEVTRNESPLRVVHRHQRSDGSTLDVEVYAAPMSVVMDGVPQLLVVESIRDLEQQVRFSHEQKLSELGRLAAGVAHEIHNPLASIRLALYGAQRANELELADRSQVQEYLELLSQEVERCIQVTERLLKLSVPSPSQPELVSLNSVLDDTLKLLHWEAENRSVEVRLEMPELPLRIMATDSEMRMLVLNLAQNALHAMPEGGALTVRCSRDNGRVEVEFADTGVGIRPTDLERIFEPFFSRRADKVRGTGLGLSITKAIVENYQGDIEVQSAPGSGSRFLVRFPDADVEPEV
jgi:signal transduction histidine kinase